MIIAHHAALEGLLGDEFAQLLLFSGSNEFDIFTPANVLCCLPENAIVHQVKKVLPKRTLRQLTEFVVLVDVHVGLHP